MEPEVPGVLRPKGGTKKFRRNCRLVAESGAIAVTDRDNNTTRFAIDGSDASPKEMIMYLQGDDFVILDRKGRGVVSSPFVLWDADENAAFCDRAGISKFHTFTDVPPPLRPDGIRLDEPAWLRRYNLWAPYVFTAGVLLAALGRALNLPLWLMLPFLPFILMYPVVRATGYFTPRRISPSDIALQKKLEDAQRKEQEAKKDETGP